MFYTSLHYSNILKISFKNDCSVQIYLSEVLSLIITLKKQACQNLGDILTGYEGVKTLKKTALFLLNFNIWVKTKILKPSSAHFFIVKFKVNLQSGQIHP